MIELQKTPPSVTEYFKSKAADFDAAVVLMHSDMGMDLMKRDVWILLTEKHLYVAEGVVSVSRSRGSLKKQSATAFMPSSLNVYKVEALKSFRMESMLSGGQLTCTEDGEPVRLFNYSGESKQDVRLLKDALDKIRVDGKVD